MKITLLILLFVSSSSFGQDIVEMLNGEKLRTPLIDNDYGHLKSLIVPDIQSNEKGKLLDKEYVFHNHVTGTWDWYGISFPGVKKIDNIARRAQVKQVVAFDELSLTDSDREGLNFFKSSEVDVSLISNGGFHRIIFPNLELVTYTGGYLNLCLCESIRDTIRGANSSHPLDLLLVEDAIFIGGSRIPLAKKDKVKIIDPEQGNALLSDLLKNLSDGEIIEYFYKNFFGEMIQLCSQNSEESLPFDLSKYQFKLFRNGKLLKTFGDGGKLIKIHIENSRDIDKKRKEIKLAKEKMKSL